MGQSLIGLRPRWLLANNFRINNSFWMHVWHKGEITNSPAGRLESCPSVLEFPNPSPFRQLLPICCPPAAPHPSQLKNWDSKSATSLINWKYIQWWNGCSNKKQVKPSKALNGTGYLPCNPLFNADSARDCVNPIGPQPFSYALLEAIIRNPWNKPPKILGRSTNHPIDGK